MTRYTEIRGRLQTGQTLVIPVDATMEPYQDAYVLQEHGLDRRVEYITWTKDRPWIVDVERNLSRYLHYTESRLGSTYSDRKEFAATLLADIHEHMKNSILSWIKENQIPGLAEYINTKMSTQFDTNTEKTPDISNSPFESDVEIYLNQNPSSIPRFFGMLSDLKGFSPYSSVNNENIQEIKERVENKKDELISKAGGGVGGKPSWLAYFLDSGVKVFDDQMRDATKILKQRNETYEKGESPALVSLRGETDQRVRRAEDRAVQSESEKKELTQQIEKLRGEIENLIMQKEKGVETIIEGQMIYLHVMQENEKLNQEVDKLREYVAQLEDKVRNLQDVAEKSETVVRQTEDSIEKKESIPKEDKTDLLHQLDQLDTMLEALSEEYLGEMPSEKKTSQPPQAAETPQPKEKRDLEVELEKLKKENEALKRENIELKKEDKTVTVQNEKLATKVKTLTVENREFQAKIGSIRDAIESFFKSLFSKLLDLAPEKEQQITQALTESAKEINKLLEIAPGTPSHGPAPGMFKDS